MRRLAPLVIVAGFSWLALASSVAVGADDSSRTWQQVDRKRQLSLAGRASFDETQTEGKITAGGILLHPESNYELQTPLATVVAKRNSLVFARISGGFEHVFVLLGNAEVQVGGHRLALRAGEEALLSDHMPTAAELMQADSIGRRRLHMTSADDGIVVGIAEFSLVHAIEREPILYRLVHSRHPEDKGLREQLIKMAAVLNYVTANHGLYVTGGQ